MLAQLINSGRLKRGVDGSYSISDAPDSNTMYGGAEQGQLFGNGLVGQAISNPIVNGVKGVTTLPGERTDYTPEEVLEYKNFIGTHGGFERLPTALQGLIWNGATDEERSLAQYAWAKKAQDNPGIGGGIASLFTGGLSDVVQGKAPGSGLGNLSPVMNFMNPGLVSGYGVIDNLKKGDWAKALNYAIDPVTEPGIDYLATKSGEGIEKLVPGFTQYGPALGALIGTAVAPGYGTLAGYELGNKIKGGSALEGVIGGATIGATYGLSSLLSPYLSSVMGKKAGAVAGKALGGIGGKAVNIGSKYLANVLNPRSAATAISPFLAQGLLQEQANYVDGGTGSGGLLSSPKQNPDLAPNTQTIPSLQVAQQQGLVPIDWEAELKKLSMPLEIKRKKEEEDTYMNYKFKPKDYLVNYL
jgi:hypothetical protein